MRPVVGQCWLTLLGVAQIGLASAVSAIIGKYLTGSFPLDDSGTLTVSCALSMRSASVCTAGYASTAASILLSFAMVALQCATSQQRSGLGFCGPILSAVGFFWWAAYAAAATAAASGAGGWDSDLTGYRIAVFAMSWCAMALFLASFFVSAAAASAEARSRQKLADARAAASGSSRAMISKRFNQPLPSPPVSPCKSNKSYSSYGGYEPFESDSPKKWAQPYNARSSVTVTSDGLRTLLVVDGEPVPLSPNLSPMHSPTHSPARSPVHRSLPPVATRGPGAGTFSNILLAQGAGQQ